MNKKEINIVDYQFSIELLKSEIDKIRIHLKENKGDSSELISRLRELEGAIKWLQKGEEYSISPDKEVFVFPDTTLQSPSSEYRIIEDFESDDSKEWKEVNFKTKNIRPLSGSWLILE